MVGCHICNVVLVTASEAENLQLTAANNLALLSLFRCMYRCAFFASSILVHFIFGVLTAGWQILVLWFGLTIVDRALFANTTRTHVAKTSKQQQLEHN